MKAILKVFVLLYGFIFCTVPVHADRYDDLINQWFTQNRNMEVGASDATDAMVLAWTCMYYFIPAIYAYETLGEVSLLDKLHTAVENIVNGTRPNALGQESYLVTSDPETYMNTDATWWHDGVDEVGESFRLIAGVLHWVYLVKSNPALPATYQADANRYLDKMENSLIKWWLENYMIDDTKDPPSDYHYPGTSMMVQPTCTTCTVNPYKRYLLTSANNKHSDFGMAMIYLYKITGNPKYLDIVRQVALRFKSVLIWGNGGEYYSWHYLDNFWKWDFLGLTLGGSPRHGSWIEHRGGYGSITMGFVTECYRMGVVFNRTDIERFVKTNRDVMYNGGNWLLNDGSVPPSGWYGSLYTPLCPYDPTLAEIGYTIAAGDIWGCPEYVYYMKIAQNELHPPDTMNWAGPLEVVDVEPLDQGSVRLTFYNPVDPVSARVPGNYYFSRGILAVRAEVNPGDAHQVTVYTTDQSPGAAMKLRIRGVKDIYGNETFAYPLANQPYLFTASSVPAGIRPERPGDAGWLPVMVRPNPSRGPVTFFVPGQQHIGITILNSRGTVVKKPAGFTWDGTDGRGVPVPTGVYVYRVTAGTVTRYGTIFIQD